MSYYIAVAVAILSTWVALIVISNRILGPHARAGTLNEDNINDIISIAIENKMNEAKDEALDIALHVASFIPRR